MGWGLASLGIWAKRVAIGLGAVAIALIAAGWIYERVAELRDQRFKSPGVLVDIGGRRMNLICSGSGTPTVVLEPGAGEFALLVSALQHRVASFTRVCSYDRAGYGWSDPAPAGRSFDERAADLDHLLDRAGVNGPYVLVGASYGGLLVRKFAQLQPQKVAGMVLVDAAEEEIVFRHLALLRTAIASQRIAGGLAEFGVMRIFVGAMAERARAEGRIPSDASPEEIEAAIAFSARPSFFATALDEGSAYERTPYAARRAEGFGSLDDKPLIVLRHGKPFDGLNAPLAEMEREWPAVQARLAALSTNSRLVVATENGHDIAMENPGLVARAVRSLVDAVRTKGSVSDKSIR
jgi:pimeloyl-ACP methyl ester carboxylesterase